MARPAAETGTQNFRQDALRSAAGCRPARLALTRPVLLALAALLLAGAALAVGSGRAAVHPEFAKLERLLAEGREAERREDSAAAGEAYRAATEQFPDHARAWACHGEFLRFFAHDGEAARGAFNRALQARIPDAQAVAFAWRGLGELELKAGGSARAIELLEKSLAAMPLADTHRSLCHVYGFMGNHAEAARYAEAALKLAPDDPIAALLAAAQLERAGRRAEGRALFARGLELGGCGSDGSHVRPVHCCVFYNAAGYYAVCGERTSALKLLEVFFNTPNHRHLEREHVLDDPDFKCLHAEPEFLKLLDAHLPAQ